MSLYCNVIVVVCVELGRPTDVHECSDGMAKSSQSLHMHLIFIMIMMMIIM